MTEWVFVVWFLLANGEIPPPEQRGFATEALCAQALDAFRAAPTPPAQAVVVGYIVTSCRAAVKE